MKWEEGRQGGKYKKMKIWSSSFFWFGSDCYLISYEPNYEMPAHTDKAQGKHFRLNIVLKGSGTFKCQKTIFRLFNRIILFRPDLYEHSMVNGDSNRLVLSLGFLRKG
jgi:hypothetical protein